MKEFLLVVHVISAVSIIAFVLLQQGKGADMGAAFGGGGSASQTLFGSRGSANFLSRTTGVLATVFFCTSLGLAWVYSNQSSENQRSITDIDQIVPAPVPVTSDVPTVPQVPSVPK